MRSKTKESLHLCHEQITMESSTLLTRTGSRSGSSTIDAILVVLEGSLDCEVAAAFLMSGEFSRVTKGFREELFFRGSVRGGVGVLLVAARVVREAAGGAAAVFSLVERVAFGLLDMVV